MCVFISLVAIGFQDSCLVTVIVHKISSVLFLLVILMVYLCTVSLLIVDYCQTVVVFIIQYLM